MPVTAKNRPPNRSSARATEETPVLTHNGQRRAAPKAENRGRGARQIEAARQDHAEELEALERAGRACGARTPPKGEKDRATVERRSTKGK